MIDVKQLLKRYERLKREHEMWEPVWQNLADFIHPRRSSFTTKRSPGSKQTERLFDSTALDAHDRLAATLNGTLTSRAAKWFSLKLRDKELNEVDEVKKWLEACSETMFRAYNQSNFAQEIHEIYLDEIALGTAALFVEERMPESRDFHGLVFHAWGLHDVVIDEDHEGRVNTVMHTFQMSAAAAVAKWGIKNVGEKVAKAFNEGKVDELFMFLHAVLPREYGASKDPKLGTPKTKLPWACAYASMADKHLIYETGYFEFPAMVPRWGKTAGEKYGRGPGHLALPDIRSLNKIKEITLKMMGKALDPPLKKKDDGVLGNVKTFPGGVSTLQHMDFLAPLFPPGTFREALGNEQIKSDELIKAIRRYFYADQMELPVGPAMTAFEVAKRFELLQRLIGPTMGRQETELLNPLIERTFGIMYRHNAFDEAPQVLLERGADIDVEYEGPLARSQRLTEIEGLERLQAYVAGVATVYPQILDIVNYDEATRLYADVGGVPSKLLRSREDVEELREQRAEEMAQQQQKADMEQMAGAAGKAAPALKLLAGGQNATA